MRFDPADGSKPTQSTVKTGTLAAPPQQNPQREGFRFDGWTYDGQPFDLQTPILQDTTLKAQWSKTADWTLSPNHGPAAGARLTISPPNRQEPGFSSVHAAGDQTVGLTGDGRIYTWTQDSTPKQVPAPAQAPDGFRYLQAAAGSRSQAALGSDQRIYTWDSGQTTPTILDTGKDARFTSISTDDDLLLAVDRQSRVHAYQASNADSQNPELIQQAAISLPGQAQAVTAAASASQALIVDEDGQAWTWEMSKTGKTKCVKQQPETRIVQAQALNQGFLLLDADGQARYLAGSTASMTPVSLPDGAQANRITDNKDQAVITDADGHVWAWKPGEAPKRADDGSQQYVQAAAAGGGIAAISRQGGMLAWSLDGQGQPGKPDRLGTTAAPTLASASLDGQALSLSRSKGSWRAEAPARKPGQAAILITGRQDGQPFARSLAYTVDQPPARAAEPGSAFTARFDTGGGNPKPADQHVSSPYGRAKRPSPDPAREGYLFDGWFTGDVAYDFSRPVDKDLTLTAHWTPAGRNTKWSISPDKGSQLGREPTTITPPDNASRGIRFSQVSGSTNPSYGFSLAVGSDGNAYAWGNNNDGQLGNGTRDDKHAPAMVKTPDRSTYPDLPADFTYVQVSAGYFHSLAVGSDGNVYAWGYNGSGQLGDGTTIERHAPVRVKTPDRKTYPDLPADFTYLQVRAGTNHSLALASDGNVYAWGWNGYGQLGDGTSASNRYTPVRVKTPDRSTYPDLPEDFTYLQVSAGELYSLAVGSDGNVYAWGNNNNGQLGDGTTIERHAPVRVKTPDRKTYPDLPADFTYLQVSAGAYHSLALGSDGNAWAWGNNQYGRLGDGTSSNRYTPVRVRTPDRSTYPDLPADFTYLQVSAGGDHSLAVGSDGNAWAWGCNWAGNLGNNTASGTSDTNPVPIRVRDPASPTDKSQGLQAAQVSAGANHSLAVGSDGNAWAWGWNGLGQLGDNSTNDKSAPVPVVFNLQLVITGVRFDQTPASGLTRGDGSSVSVTTPAHQPGTVTVSVDYTLGGTPQTPDTSLRYTYLPAGVLPKAGGEGILLALATGMTGMGGVLASRRHRREQHQLLHASHE
ncbi:InlB B-repeat-containing protein [Bifidobacterium sp. H6bp9]|uniref:RCC1 domain-containing protein n=1 Tax=Bifidobacterium sp. H6bp9 TaxID=3051961 RepID=UPI0028BD1FFB|nr:InlB B-repeat-containing protein [Bifidobacterium sp. H6bp9]MDT7511481.1 InlB B-repeat-containing protein [Bifidobacterium sp. H6bp9]